MIDRNDPHEEEMYQKFRKACTTMTGMNFALLMRQENGTLELHERPNQPCQGGEMRKYESTHPGDCTRPTDPRPSDLRMPFPKGIPEAVGKCLNSNQLCWADTIETILTKGPYQKIAPPAPVDDDHFEIITKKGILAKGLMIFNTDVNPTLLVNCLQFINIVGHVDLDDYREYGLTDEEILAFLMLGNEAGYTSYTDANYQSGGLMIPQTHNYYFPQHASIRRIIEGDFRDLNEYKGRSGTFRERYDYNRPEVQDLFKETDTSKSSVFQREMFNELKSRGMISNEHYKFMKCTKADYYDCFKTIIRRAYQPNVTIEVEKVA